MARCQFRRCRQRLTRTYWSSFDASVDLAAPGEDILSVDSAASERSATPHWNASGTSMASPVVAGVAALVKEQHPGWDAQQIEDQLTSTAKDLGVTGKDPNYGYGIVDAAAAVGVVAPNPKNQNHINTWADRVYPTTKDPADRDDVIIGWTTPNADPVTGYTVTVHTDTGTTDYPVDGMTGCARRPTCRTVLGGRSPLTPRPGMCRATLRVAESAPGALPTTPSA